MESVFQEYKPKKPFLVCVDSDGCAMDTMDIKHIQCFCPALIEEWKLENISDKVEKIWYAVNLFSMTRGINRFKGLAITLNKVNEMGIAIEGLERIENWVTNAPQLSNAALQEEVRGSGDVALEKALAWSLKVNQLIHELEGKDAPFPMVKESLEHIAKYADIAVVSSANSEALQSEWKRHSLIEHVDILLGQEVGSKVYCIKRLLECGYDRKNVVMVGDAPGDLEAAQQNEVFYYPILVRKEQYSWNRLGEEFLSKLVHGNLDDDYQIQLNQEFITNLNA